MPKRKRVGERYHSNGDKLLDQNKAFKTPVGINVV